MLQMPKSEHEWKMVGRKFEQRCNFPQCIEAIDGKHVKIWCPFRSGSEFYNYNGVFSIILFAIVDAELNFTYICIGTNGHTQDVAVWTECSFKEGLEKNTLNFSSNHVIVADDVFPFKQNILKTYSKTKLSAQKWVFHYRLLQARTWVKNAFGILAARFRIFLRTIEIKTSTVDDIVWAACSLHNWLWLRNP